MTGNAGGGFDGAAVRKKEIGQSSNLTFSRIEALFGSSGGQRMDGQLYYVTACFIYFGILGVIFMIAGIAWKEEASKMGDCGRHGGSGGNPVAGNPVRRARQRLSANLLV